MHPSEGRFTKPRPDCPHPERWHSADGDATEDEVIEFFAALVRATQPDTVLETGTHLGHMAQAVGKALLLNGQGVLHTYEPDRVRHEQAMARCEGLPVELHNQPSMTGTWGYGRIDLAWFDSLLHLREQEFDWYLPFMHDRTMVCFHDAGPHHGPWSMPLRRHPRLKVIDLPTPRGCLVGRVVK